MTKYVPGSQYSFSQQDANRILKAIVVPLCNYLDLSELVKGFEGRSSFDLLEVGFSSLTDVKELPYDLFSSGIIGDDEWRILFRDAMLTRFEEIMTIRNRST